MRKLGLIHRPHPNVPMLAAHLQINALAPVSSCDWHRFATLNGDALGNDAHSNCIPCGALRSVQIMRAVVAGDRRVPTVQNSLALYQQMGWDGTVASDIGLPSDETTAFWASKGIWWGNDWLDIPSFARIDPSNPEHARLAIAYFGPLQVDILLPNSAQSQTKWTVVPGPTGAVGSWGPHRVCIGKYDSHGFTAVTWGTQIEMTDEFFLAYVANIEVPISRSWFNTVGVSPTGLDFESLAAASSQLAPVSP